MRTPFWIILMLIATFVCIDVQAQEIANPIPYSVLPYYRREPFNINASKYNHELSTNNPKELLELSYKIENELNTIKLDVIYVLAIRLYNLGLKDDAFYFLQTAQTRRAIVVNSFLRGVNQTNAMLTKSFHLFDQTISEYINGYGFNNIDTATKVMEMIKNDIKYIQPYDRIYSDCKFVDDYTFEETKRNQEKEMEEAIKYFRENKEAIKRKRIEDGVQDKY